MLPVPCRGDRLTQVVPGMAVLVEHVHGDEIFRGKMMAMGIVPGVLSFSTSVGAGGRPLLIALAGGRLLLDSRSSELINR
jgi:Fe2+ transport system protein FeoA